MRRLISVSIALVLAAACTSGVPQQQVPTVQVDSIPAVSDTTTSLAYPKTSTSSTSMPTPSESVTDEPAAALLTMVDAESRNTVAWPNEIACEGKTFDRDMALDTFGPLSDAFVPIHAMSDANGLPVIVYWVGLDSLPGCEFPDEIAALAGPGTVRVAHCVDTDCVEPAAIHDMIDNAPWITAMVSSAALRSDGSLVMIWPRDSNGMFWNLTSCDDAECSSPTVTGLETIIPDERFDLPVPVVDQDDNLALVYGAGMDDETGMGTDLVLLTCGNRDCTEGKLRTVLDSSVGIGLGGYHLRQRTIHIDDTGRMFVAYGSGPSRAVPVPGLISDGEIRLAICRDLACTGGPAITTIAKGTSPIVVSKPAGNLSIWYQTPLPEGPEGPGTIGAEQPLSIQIAHCANDDCTSFTDESGLQAIPEDVTIGMWDDFFSRMDIKQAPSGNPHITYWAPFGAGTIYLSCSDTNCNAGISTEIGLYRSTWPHILTTNEQTAQIIVGGTRGIRILRCADAVCTPPN